MVLRRRHLQSLKSGFEDKIRVFVLYTPFRLWRCKERLAHLPPFTARCSRAARATDLGDNVLWSGIELRERERESRRRDGWEGNERTLSDWSVRLLILLMERIILVLRLL